MSEKPKDRNFNMRMDQFETILHIKERVEHRNTDIERISMRSALDFALTAGLEKLEGMK